MKELYQNKKDNLLKAIPSNYRPYFHLFFPISFAGFILGLSLGFLNGVTWLQLLTPALSFLLLLALEWTVHKYLMHTPILPRFLYRKHIDHHLLYTDENMEIKSLSELYYVLMPSVAVILVFIVALLPTIILSLLLSINVGLLWLATAMFFFIFYELTHLSYHLPNSLKFFQNLKKVHQTHHKLSYMHKFNFNVTIPLFDLILRTKK